MKVCLKIDLLGYFFGYELFILYDMSLSCRTSVIHPTRCLGHSILWLGFGAPTNLLVQLSSLRGFLTGAWSFWLELTPPGPLLRLEERPSWLMIRQSKDQQARYSILLAFYLAIGLVNSRFSQYSFIFYPLQPLSHIDYAFYYEVQKIELFDSLPLIPALRILRGFRSLLSPNDFEILPAFPLSSRSFAEAFPDICGAIVHISDSHAHRET